ncbi:MAG: xylanase [Paucimonas sp.]|nr:xylanase [Paucimonas sp.]
MPLLVLKIDVDTCRGTLEGVPALVRLLQRHGAQASFLFSLGPDHTGWALKRAFRPGFFSKVSRTSVLEHYGLKTLSYGVLLPAPDIGRRGAAAMRAVRDAGFECGVHTWDHVVWQDNVRKRDAAWTSATMQKSWQRFEEIFGAAPATHGAAGWQMNEHAFARLDALGIAYSSDSRELLREDGSLARADAGPYRLRAGQAIMQCLQMPTTLPTLDELLGRSVAGRALTTGNVADFLLELSAAPRDHVYTLHAELEGQKLAPIFDKLLSGWRSQGYTLASMARYHQTLDPAQLPVRALQWGELPGRSGELVLA